MPGIKNTCAPPREVKQGNKLCKEPQKSRKKKAFFLQQKSFIRPLFEKQLLGDVGGIFSRGGGKPIFTDFGEKGGHFKRICQILGP